MYENWVEIGKEECIALVKEKSILLEIGATYKLKNHSKSGNIHITVMNKYKGKV